jgi:hypothetical protein
MKLATLLPVFEWLQHTYIAETIRHSPTLIATLEIVHLIGLAMLLGTILMVDLSLLGWGIGDVPASRIASESNRWTVAGLVTMIASGPLIFISEAVRCSKAPAFWIKMGLLAPALIFHFTVHRGAATGESVPEHPRRTACLSLALWFGVAVAAKAIGFSETN